MIDLSLICKNELKAPKNLKAFSEINKVAGTKKQIQQRRYVFYMYLLSSVSSISHQNEIR